MNRRAMLQTMLLGSAGAALGTGLGAGLDSAGATGVAAKRIEPLHEEGGLYSQRWFLNSFLELASDLEEANEENKRFAIIWEQPACPYCRDLHVINFADPDVNQWIRERFAILQLSLAGSRRMVDFDGQETTERGLSRKYRVNFTPTIQFFPKRLEEFPAKSGMQAEIIRMPGYFRPYHFISMFEFIHYERYRDTHFQGYLAERRAKAEKAGIPLGKPLPSKL